MISVAVYNATTGRVLRGLTMNAEEIPYNIEADEGWLEIPEPLPAGIHYIEDGEIVFYGTAPSSAHYFDHDAKAWALDPDALKEAYRQAVQAHIDATARARDYDSGVSLASYVGDPNATWASEAAAFVAWRSSVWAFVFNWLSEIDAGTQAPPESAEALVAALPEMEWPT